MNSLYDAMVDLAQKYAATLTESPDAIVATFTLVDQIVHLMSDLIDDDAEPGDIFVAVAAYCTTLAEALEPLIPDGLETVMVSIKKLP